MWSRRKSIPARLNVPEGVSGTGGSLVSAGICSSVELLEAHAFRRGKRWSHYHAFRRCDYAATAAKAGSSAALIPTAEAVGFHKMPFKEFMKQALGVPSSMQAARAGDPVMQNHRLEYGLTMTSPCWPA